MKNSMMFQGNQNNQMSNRQQISHPPFSQAFSQYFRRNSTQSFVHKLMATPASPHFNPRKKIFFRQPHPHGERHRSLLPYFKDTITALKQFTLIPCSYDFHELCMRGRDLIVYLSKESPLKKQITRQKSHPANSKPFLEC